MERVLFYLRIFPGTEAEYDRRHAAVPRSSRTRSGSPGFRNMTGFRRGTDVWYYAEAEPDGATAFAVHGPKPANQRWNKRFATSSPRSRMPQGSRSSTTRSSTPTAALTGRMSRGLFALVIDPERAADYEALHANPGRT